jgi:hypothetical protein
MFNSNLRVRKEVAPARNSVPIVDPRREMSKNTSIWWAIPAILHRLLCLYPLRACGPRTSETWLQKNRRKNEKKEWEVLLFTVGPAFPTLYSFSVTCFLPFGLRPFFILLQINTQVIFDLALLITVLVCSLSSYRKQKLFLKSRRATISSQSKSIYRSIIFYLLVFQSPIQQWDV